MYNYANEVSPLIYSEISRLYSVHETLENVTTCVHLTGWLDKPNHVQVTCHSGLGIHGLPVLVLTLPVLRQKRIGLQPILGLPQSPLYYGYALHVNALQT